MPRVIGLVRNVGKAGQIAGWRDAWIGDAQYRFYDGRKKFSGAQVCVVAAVAI